MHYKIKGPNQERNGALSKCLTNSNFSDQLVKFVLDHWAENEECASILGDKRMFVSYGQQCYLFGRNFEKKKIVKGLENNHIEIESKIVLHLQKIVAKNILIKISSTDALLVYLIYHMQFWPSGREIWIETGDVNKNTRRLINVSAIYGQLSHALTNALPAWYAFTGCAYENPREKQAFPNFIRKPGNQRVNISKRCRGFGTIHLCTISHKRRYRQWGPTEIIWTIVQNRRSQRNRFQQKWYAWKCRKKTPVILGLFESVCECTSHLELHFSHHIPTRIDRRAVFWLKFGHSIFLISSAIFI